MTNRPAGRVTERVPVRGFTLIELMVVIAIIALAAGVTSLALRDPTDTQLEREAVRLSALLESARTEARSLGLRVVWSPVPAGVTADPATGVVPQFRFAGLPRSSALPTRWLNPDTTAEVGGASAVVLGPEPLIGAQRIVLRLDRRAVALVTDGLGPFTLVDRDAATPLALR